jgi:hypothetical protein
LPEELETFFASPELFTTELFAKTELFVATELFVTTEFETTEGRSNAPLNLTGIPASFTALFGSSLAEKRLTGARGEEGSIVGGRGRSIYFHFRHKTK